MRKLKEDWCSSNYAKLIFLIPYRLIQGVLRPLHKLTQASHGYVHKGDLRVPMFFSEPHWGTYNTWIFVIVITTPFGCVHMVPSFFFTSSSTETWLWRISAAFITFQPFFSLVFEAAFGTLSQHVQVSDSFLFPVGTVMLASLPLYIFARLALIVLSFLSLRDIPHKAHCNIDWISSVPHL